MSLTRSQSASKGSWIKETFRGDRSLGYVTTIDHKTKMMRVKFPKTHSVTWLSWENFGQYKVINLVCDTKK
tara:strand:+ start:224 stop:436 length:213 start_codon:yes stop_codon:yes gene_type:complete